MQHENAFGHDHGEYMTGLEKFFWLIAGLILALAVYVQYTSAFAGDRNWLLVAGRMWLDGKVLYRDIFEVNPPLIIWIYGLVVFLSNHSGLLKDYQVLAVMGFATVALTVTLSVRILVFHDAFKRNPRKSAQLALLLAYIFIVWPNPVYFADREHIFMMLTLPYLLRRLPSVSGANMPLWLRIVIGFMAAIGFCIKPHTLIVFAGIQLAVLMRERTWRVLFILENALICAGGAFYVGLVLLLTPDYLRTVLPMALETYSEYGNKLSGLEFLIVALFIFALTFVDFRRGHASPYRRDIMYFLMACPAYLAYAWVNNGWGYSYNPLISLLFLICGWVLWEFSFLKRGQGAQGLSVRQFQFGIRDCWIVFLANTGFILFAYFQAFTAVCGDNAVCRLHDRFVQVMHDSEARSFGTITTTYVLWPNLVRDGNFAWNTRFNHLWMLPAFMRSGPEFTQKHKWVLDYVADALAQDMDERKPDIIFVDNNQSIKPGGPAVDLAAYFSDFSHFRQAWKHYRYAQTIHTCDHPEKITCSMDVYRRIPEKS